MVAKSMLPGIGTTELSIKPRGIKPIPPRCRSQWARLRGTKEKSVARCRVGICGRNGFEHSQMAMLRLRFYFFAVPGSGSFAEVGFVGQVAGQRGVVAEDDVLDVGLAGAHSVEVGP